MSEVKLKLCPNPSCTYSVDQLAIAGHSEVGHWVVCRACHMRGPQGQYRLEAVNLWNALPRKGAK